MVSLIHIIYSSAAAYEFSEDDLMQLLAQARAHNASIGVTGMLLYSEGSFFQIIEGEPEIINALFAKIAKDPRHTKVVTIINEPIRKRSFGEWTMGYTSITPQEVGQIVGLNDFFMQASCFGQLDPGRAKKILAAFKEGRWRTKVSNSNLQESPHFNQLATMQQPNVSFAFQPIIDINTSSVISFEALLRGVNNEAYLDVLADQPSQYLSHFDSDCRAIAIGMASRLGLACNLNLNFMARDIDDTRASMRTMVDTAKINQFDTTRIMLEIDQDRLIGDLQKFGKLIEEFRQAGFKISIDHFGAGRAGLNLLEPYRPEMISLNENLVRSIESNGPRQAIVRGVAQICSDLGIDIVAKNIETLDEYYWFRDEGFNLFQGNLFAKPVFEALPSAYYPA